MTAALAAKDVVALRGRWATNLPFDLEVHRGTICLMRGANGAGKTTVLEALLGLRRYRGSITRAYGGVGYAPQGSEYLRSLTIREAAALLSVAPDRVTPFGPNAAIDIDRQLGRMTGGEIQQVKVRIALLRAADLIVLDEPFASVDAAAAAAMLEAIKVARKNAAVLIVDHERVDHAWADLILEVKPADVTSHGFQRAA